MALRDNWQIKIGIIVAIAIAAYVGVQGYNVAQYISMQRRVVNVITEKYRAPTKDAWMKVYAALDIPYDENRKLTASDYRKYLEIVAKERGVDIDKVGQ